MASSEQKKLSLSQNNTSNLSAADTNELATDNYSRNEDIAFRVTLVQISWFLRENGQDVR